MKKIHWEIRSRDHGCVSQKIGSENHAKEILAWFKEVGFNPAKLHIVKVTTTEDDLSSPKYCPFEHRQKVRALTGAKSDSFYGGQERVEPGIYTVIKNYSVGQTVLWYIEDEWGKFAGNIISELNNFNYSDGYVAI